MKILRPLFILCLAAPLLIPPHLHADDAGKGKTAAAYLWMPASARAAAMGNTLTSFADDAAAIFYNPAGLAQPRRHELQMTSSFSSADRSYYGLAYGFSFPKAEAGTWGGGFAGLGRSVQFNDMCQGLGVGVLTYGVQDIVGYDMFANPQSSFADSENTVVIGYGAQANESLAWGISAEWHTHALDDASASGFSFDFGLLYHIVPQLTAGLSIRNLGGGLAWKVPDDFLDTNDTYSEKIAMRSLLGATYNASDSLSLVADIDYTAQQNINWHLGTEYRLSDVLRLRAGFDGLKPSTGFGLRSNISSSTGLLFDYAFRFDTEGFYPLHQVSLSLLFGGGGTEEYQAEDEESEEEESDDTEEYEDE
jgi:hypothetical protein